MADEQQRKAQARAQRFANDAKKPPPPPPKKTFAHPGGKMTTNKEEALRKYLARKGDSLNAAQKQALEDLQRKGLAPPTPPKPAEDRTDKLFVGNLPYKLDDQKLGALFASRYHVIGSKIVLDRQTNRGRGFGFVTFGSSEDARAAHDAFQGVKVEGRLLTVKYATQRGQKAQKPVLRKDGWGSWATPSAPAAAAPEAVAPAAASTASSAGGGGIGASSAGSMAGGAGSRAGGGAGVADGSSTRAAPAADEKPLESEAPVEAVSLWKIATSTEVEAWRAAGTLAGSALDKKDGFVHCATADQARVVADLYFAGQQDLKLLRVSVESLPRDTMWTRESDDGLRGRPGVAVRLVPADDIKKYRNGRDVLHDGCLHLHAAPPLPWSSVDEFDLPLVDGKHAFPAQCVATEGPRAQSLGGFSITY